MKKIEIFLNPINSYFLFNIEVKHSHNLMQLSVLDLQQLSNIKGNVVILLPRKFKQR